MKRLLFLLAITLALLVGCDSPSSTSNETVKVWLITQPSYQTIYARTYTNISGNQVLINYWYDTYGSYHTNTLILSGDYRMTETIVPGGFLK